MMLNIRLEGDQKHLLKTPLSFFIVFILSAFLYFLIVLGFSEILSVSNYIDWIKTIDATQNIVTIGQVLYTVYFHYFILAAYILLIGMLGAIVLTLHHRRDVRRQNIFDQLKRNFAVSIKKHN